MGHPRILPLLAAAALIASAAGTARAQDLPEGPRGGMVEWTEDLDAALERAAEARRPLLLYFTHDC